MKQPELGHKIAQLRRESNLSQEELTDKCNVSVRTIQRIEAGEVTPRTYTIRILLAALNYEYENLKMDDLPEEKHPSGLTSLLLLNEVPPRQLLQTLQISWIAGVVYFVIGIIESALDYSLYVSNNLDMMGKVFYSLLKVWVLVSYLLFISGFTALSYLFNNYLLKVSSFLLIAAMTVIVGIDIFAIFLALEEETLMLIYVSEGVTAGAISIIFGTALIRLKDSMGKLSGYAGVLEMILGASFVTVIFFMLGFALMIPATILEIILLYKGYDFLKQELQG